MLQLFARQAEVKLVENLNAIADPDGWRVIHFHLDKLIEEYKSDYHIKIAINLINDLLRPYEGGIFVLADRSIVVLCNGLDKAIQSKLIFQLRYLYMDDLLAYDAGGKENPGFCTDYDLGDDGQMFLDIVSRRMTLAGRRASPTGRAMPASPSDAASSGDTSDFSVSRLADIERELQHVDLSKVIRRQPVCALPPGGTARKVFDEIYIHIAHLRKFVGADVDLLSNKWLFKYLTHALDVRMLNLIGRNAERYCGTPISLNLNAETLLSSAFSEFDAALTPAMKIAVVIEVPVVDVFADIAGFVVARNEVHKLGYRLCLDGLTTRSFVNIEREKLKLDLLKVQWNADAESDLKTPENQELARAIQACGTRRIILCRCDSKQAVDYGQALGISLFQGRYIDSVLNPAALMEN